MVTTKTRNLRRSTVRTQRATRRGVAMLAFVVAVLVLGALVVWQAVTTALASRAYLGHYLSGGALYASESGIELAVREVMQAADLDGDGAIGTISNDGNDGNDPSLLNGSFHVTASGTDYVSYGAWRQHVRVTEVTVE